MIVWLASYPRSGNTLLRILLNKTFGLQSMSVYEDPEIAAKPALAQIVGHRALSGDLDELHRRPEVVGLKTHGLPGDDHKAIYVVRDGRAAIVSLYHYRREFAGEEAITMADIIDGRQGRWQWSNHVRAWTRRRTGDTLVLRFEDLVADPAPSMKRVADFLALPQVAAAAVRFDDLKSIEPRFFRSGSNATNITELKGDDLLLFWAIHGRTMARLGYGDGP